MNQIRRYFAQSSLHRKMWAMFGQVTIDQQIVTHAIKTVIAACMAAGGAMLLELPQPHTAVVTVFVLMQPLSGMVLAKSFYRVVGTLFGTFVAVGITALFPQTPELYLAAIAVWCAICTGASVRYRHFRWYAWVLAAYTAILIAVPTATHPTDIFLAALTRAAEVTLGILCSTLVSMLIFPLKAGDLFLAKLRSRYTDLTTLASDALGGTLTAREFDRRFALLVDGMANLEAARVFATFESPFIRARTRRLAKLNDEFSHACSRLYALCQLMRRLEKAKSGAALALLKPHLRALAQTIGTDGHFALPNDLAPSRVASRMRAFRSRFLETVRVDRAAILDESAATLVDFDTAREILLRFIGGFIRYAITYESLKPERHRLERTSTRYHVTADRYAVSFAALRSLLVVGIAGWFWVVTAWPSGAYAVVGAAMAGPLSSLSPNPAKLTWRMTLGTALSVVVAYVYLCYIYPSIGGFTLLCVVLAPALAISAYLAAIPAAAGFGVGFSVFFAFLAIPDNVTSYDPALLVNNGIALVASMAVSALIFSVVFPPGMPWLARRLERALRRQVCSVVAAPLGGLEQRFQSATHDVMFQLSQLHLESPERKQVAWRWMLATLETGYAAIDLRRHMLALDVDDSSSADWPQMVNVVMQCLSEIFADPNRRNVVSAESAIDRAIAQLEQTIHDMPTVSRTVRIRRVIYCLHFLRTSLMDNDSPLKA
jgi:uncharacterized membrane protein YccC